VYPVKSCAGISLPSAKIGKYGFDFDREWVIVRGNTGRFVSQREYPKLALITPKLNPQKLTLTAPGMSEIIINVDRKIDPLLSSQVRVWSTTGMGMDEGEEIALWLQEFLQKEGLRLKRLHKPRDIEPKYKARSANSQNELSFSDSAPFLIVSELGIQQLNSKLPSPIDYRRFRPNILVSDDMTKNEEKWDKIRIGEVSFTHLGPCERCKLTTVDPDLGEFTGSEPLKTINQKEYKPGLFGEYYSHSLSSQSKTLHIGMEIYSDS